MLDHLAAEFTRPFGGFSGEVVLVRLFAAALLGGAIGFEREHADKPAGLRTHILVSLAACLFTLLAFAIMQGIEDSASHVRTDPIRVIEAVTAGVAFLAAGAIIQSRGSVKGLTTGAGMWMAGAVGVASGAGELGLALTATLMALIVLWLLKRLEKAR